MEPQSIFSPRIGKLTFPCKFCGKEPMQWTEVAPDSWMPFDLEKREIHCCWHKKSNKLKKNDAAVYVADELHRLGYVACVPRTSTWNHAFPAVNEIQSIVFLVRKGGIDFKIYDGLEKFEVDGRGKLYTLGGHLIRNDFGQNDILMMEWVLNIASRFITSTPIDIEFLSSDEPPWALEKARSLRSECLRDDDDGRRELRDIYDDFAVVDGEDAYLGDGVWIGSNGSWDDRGR